MTFESSIALIDAHLTFIASSGPLKPGEGSKCQCIPSTLVARSNYQVLFLRNAADVLSMAANHFGRARGIQLHGLWACSFLCCRNHLRGGGAFDSHCSTWWMRREAPQENKAVSTPFLGKETRVNRTGKLVEMFSID